MYYLCLKKQQFTYSDAEPRFLFGIGALAVEELFILKLNYLLSWITESHTFNCNSTEIIIQAELNNESAPWVA
jgi:hypothetical protein